MALLLKDVKPGDVLIADDGFGCLKEGQEVIVQADEEGELFVPCAHGNRHWLEGQLNEDGSLSGLTKRAVQ